MVAQRLVIEMENSYKENTQDLKSVLDLTLVEIPVVHVVLELMVSHGLVIDVEMAM